jgi:energy-coupling factor transport system ATP-binding protein
MPQEFVCDLRDVWYTYSGARAPALRGVSLRVRKGEWLGILGSNGSGKSTLARLMNALLIPTQGACFVDGLSTAASSCVPAIRRTVSLVFQNPENQIVGTTVEDDAAFGPENIGLSSEAIRSRVRTALSTVGLSAKAGKPTYTLSGGEKQRLAIAGALALDTPCIVLDEPTAMLDPAGRSEVLDVLSSLHRQGRSIIYITHRLEEALRCDRVVVLHSGEIVSEGSAVDILTRKDCGEWGIEPPPLLLLWRSLVDSGIISPDTKPVRSCMEAALCRLS